jgi:hypothetical protein
MNDLNKSDEPGLPHRRVETREALRNALLDLLRGAHREFLVVSPALDAALFNGQALGEELGHFLARHTGNHARLVVEDTEQMLTTCTRLVELARRFPDLILIRRLGEAHHGLSEMFAVADGAGCLVQAETGILNATLDLASPARAAPLVRRFEDIWAAAEPVPGLHIFHL